MEFLELAKNQALIKHSLDRQGIDTNAIETLVTLQGSLNHINEALENFLSRFGLSQGKFTILILLLDAKEGMQPSKLAADAGVTRATITGLLDGLERDGLIKREHDQGDRRTLTVRMTPVAMGVMEGVLGEYYRKIGRWIGSVSGGGRRTLVGALSNILDRIDENTDEPLPL